MARGISPREEAARRGGATAHEPWLEEAEDEWEDEREHTLVGRRTLLAILFLAAVLIVGVIVGVSLVADRSAAPIDIPRVGETVPVLASPGPWKVEPTGPDIEGVPVEGQGQVMFGTGDGREVPAEIALDALPEEPLPRPAAPPPEDDMASAPAPDAVQPAPTAPAATPAPIRPPPAPVPPAPRPSATVVPREAPAPRPVPAPAPKAAPAAAPEASGAVIQLGAFSSEARARTAFRSLADRYVYLQGLTPLIVPVTADGRTLYRLRVPAGSSAAARDLCGRLRVAGEACQIVE